MSLKNQKIDKIVAQAKESIKILESFQKEGLAKALAMLPTKDEAKRITNEKIVASLRKMGLATRGEVRELEKKIEDLASEIRSQMTKINRKGGGHKKEDSETHN